MSHTQDPYYLVREEIQESVRRAAAPPDPALPLPALPGALTIPSRHPGQKLRPLCLRSGRLRRESAGGSANWWQS